MDYPLLLAVFAVVVGAFAAGVAIISGSDDSEQALERDEREVSRGRDVGSSPHR